MACVSAYGHFLWNYAPLIDVVCRSLLQNTNAADRVILIHIQSAWGQRRCPASSADYAETPGPCFVVEAKPRRSSVRKRNEAGWSGIRESNPHLQLGKLTYYHCTNPASKRPQYTSMWDMCGVERMTRLELATYAMARRRSSQLSYIRLRNYGYCPRWSGQGTRVEGTARTGLW